MATLDSLQFEMERRVILFKPTTTMPDLSQLGYNADPNLIVTPSTAGEELIYYSPNNTRYVNYDASGNTIQEWAVGFDPTTFSVYRQVYDQDGNPLDGVFVDTNGDNIINDADRLRYKKANHDVYFGITSNFNYKWT